jgi:hypothetical protein
MYAETYRPSVLDDVIGHSEAKESLRNYLKTPGFPKAIMLSGSPGIGKTTLALAAAKSMGFDPLEINASRSIRSYDDVEKIKNACKSTVNIYSFMKGDRDKKTCVILDEVDGSDPHAQGKIVEWIKDSTRGVPILCTGNELPTIFKRNAEHIELIRCFPPKAIEVQTIFNDIDIIDMLKDCHHDIRKLTHRIQYGMSDPIPKYSAPPTGLPVEKTFVLRQRMFELHDSLHEYRVYILDNEQTSKTSQQYKSGDKHDRIAESDKPLKKLVPGKSHKSKLYSASPPMNG